jgi:hypothetical protein
VAGLAAPTALANEVRAMPRIGAIVAGAGLAADFLAQALALPGAPTPDQSRITLDVTLRASSASAMAVTIEPSVALPLLVSGLAQRIPGTRGLRSRMERPQDRKKERALA